MRLIDADKLLEDFGEEPLVWCDGETEVQERNDWRMYKSMVEASPTIEAVSRGAYDQVRWERDVAIEQLESYGISLGEKADVTKVVHARWIWTVNGEANHEQYWVCSHCKEHSFIKTRYCSDCGATMDLESEGNGE